MKIVLNKCYGGFSLSEKAVLRLVELGNKVALAGFEKQNEYIENGKLSLISDCCREIYRHDPDLIKVVEELGDEANGPCAKLQIEDIPGYEIHEYDGFESIKY